MAQKVTGYIKLQIEAGKATPAPPVGPALGQKGVNIMAFTKEFNERTKNQMGYVIPVVITVYADRSFSFITKTPPAAVLIKKAAGINTASGKPNKEKVASLTAAQVEEIAKTKTEIKINRDYFEQQGISFEEPEEEQPEEKTEKAAPEISVNLDSEYFKWKEQEGKEEDSEDEKQPEKKGFFGKFMK